MSTRCSLIYNLVVSELEAHVCKETNHLAHSALEPRLLTYVVEFPEMKEQKRKPHRLCAQNLDMKHHTQVFKQKTQKDYRTTFIQGLLLVVKQVNSVHITYLSCHSTVQAELVSELLKTLTLHDVPSPACDSCVPSNSQDEILQQLKTENHTQYHMKSWLNNSKSF